MGNDISFEYRNKRYPLFVKEGNHTQYILPFAQKICNGKGIDIGCAKESWAFPGADKCDLTLKSPWDDATKIPVEDEHYDFVFSSHCLEHLDDYYAGLEEWTRILKKGGILFLYLPSVECEYWRPANNRKHKHILYAKDIEYDLRTLGIDDVFTSNVDLAYSYAVYGVKKGG